jgi:hypothetical protein
LVSFVAAQHNAPVSSNFCKELDSARFYQRAFFCLTFCVPGLRLQAIIGPHARDSFGNPVRHVSVFNDV